MDYHGTELIYRRVVNPGIDHINHANKLGIRLKSTSALRTPSIPHHVRRSQLTPRRHDQFATNKAYQQGTGQQAAATNFIQDVIMPISPVPHTDEYNAQRSNTPQSFASSTKMKQMPLPQVAGRKSAPGSARNIKTLSMCSERQYLSCVPSERLLSAQIYDDHNEDEFWNKSGQALRYSNEQRHKDRSKTLKRVSEIRPHRVDRMYYMSGSRIPIPSRYGIDADELARLRNLMSSRSKFSRTHVKGHIGWEDVTPTEKQVQNYIQRLDDPEVENQLHPYNSLATLKHGPQTSIFMTDSMPDAGGDLGSREPSKYESTSPRNNKDYMKLGEECKVEHDNPDIDSVAGELHTSRENADANINTGKDVDKQEDIVEEDEEVEKWDVNADAKEALLLQNGTTTAKSVHSITAPAPTPANDLKSSTQSQPDSFITEQEEQVQEQVQEQVPAEPLFVMKKEKELFQKNDAMNVDFTTKKTLLAEYEDDEKEDTDDIDSPTKPTVSATLANQKNADKEDGDGTLDLSSLMDVLTQSNEQINHSLYEGQISADELSKMKDDNKMASMFRNKTQHLAPKMDAKEELKKSLQELEHYSFVSDLQEEVFLAKFRELDVDGSGTITAEELSTNLFKNATKQDLGYFMKVFDLNQDKMIDKSEFVTLLGLNDKLNGHMTINEDESLELNLPRLAYHITVYKEMFELADQDMDGKLSIKDVMLIMTTGLGQEVGTDKELVDIIHRTIDKDNSGYIDFVEYLSYIPFFIKLHQHLMAQPILIEHIETARKLVRQALRRKPNKDAGIGHLKKKTADIWQ